VTKLAAWNVNSVRAREERLLRWLSAHRPDVMCLQELKVQDEDFPLLALKAERYHAVVHGQKTYNGVAILARTEPTDVEKGLPGDTEARLVSARIRGVRIFSIYAPNGGEVGSDKWQHKLDWLRRLRAHLDAHLDPMEPAALCGDFNVAPEARDVADPPAWEDSVLFHPEARAALRRVLDFGLVDAFRLHHPEAGFYSWWDYRQLAFPRNKGLRIDHVFTTEPLARRSTAASIDRNERKGKRPSDHVPVVAEFAD
jgi:exodeoxyribonuclease-3